MEEKQLSTFAFEALRSTTTGANVCRRELVLYEKLIWNETDRDRITQQFLAAVYVAYYEYDNSKNDIIATVAALEKQMQSLSRQCKASSTDLRCIYAANEFRTTYVGDADVEFRHYLASCCSAYLAHTREYTAPCITIKQSSGFGKSRILQRLAESTAEGTPLVYVDNEFDAVVLYVCPRNAKEFKGYPRPTKKLRDWLFPERNLSETKLASSLMQAFKYAVEHSDAARQWKVVFDNDDETIVEQLQNFKITSNTRYPVAKKVRKIKTPVLVAQSLLDIKNYTGIDALQMLSGALKRVNNSETVRAANGVVFVVLVNSYSRVSRSDSSYGIIPVSFPPFILTQTMDVMLKNSTSSNLLTTSKSRVLNADADEVWGALVSMGRPLWQSRQQGSTLAARQRAINEFATSKLLQGRKARLINSYNDSTLNGVASLFCRVGLQ